LTTVFDNDYVAHQIIAQTMGSYVGTFTNEIENLFKHNNRKRRW